MKALALALAFVLSGCAGLFGGVELTPAEKTLATLELNYQAAQPAIRTAVAQGRIRGQSAMDALEALDVAEAAMDTARLVVRQGGSALTALSAARTALATLTAILGETSEQSTFSPTSPGWIPSGRTADSVSY